MLAAYSRLQWGHGDEAVEELSKNVLISLPFRSFNGATAMKPWKRPTSAVVQKPASPLQWGHGDEAVEEDLSSPINHSARDSLQWGHGDEAVEEAASAPGQWKIFPLQWGHGDEAVEELITPGPTAPSPRLQWGHGDEAVEERTVRSVTPCGLVASMGPRR